MPSNPGAKAEGAPAAHPVPPAVGAGGSSLTRQLTREEIADALVVIILGTSLFLAVYANILVTQVLYATGGFAHAQLLTALLEADGVLGAFFAAIFAIRYELTRLWREERDETKPKSAEELAQAAKDIASELRETRRLLDERLPQRRSEPPDGNGSED